MRQRGVYRHPQPSDPLPTWAIFVPTPIPGQPDSVGEGAIRSPAPTIPDPQAVGNPEAPAPEEASTPDVQAQAQRLLDFGKRHGWPALRITPWCTLPGGEFHWRRFAEHLVEASKVPLVEAERRRMFALAIAALEASEKQGCS